MIASSFPDIASEWNSIKYMIRGLEHHPDFRYVVETWTSQLPATIQGLQTMATYAQSMSHFITSAPSTTPFIKSTHPTTYQDPIYQHNQQPAYQHHNHVPSRQRRLKYKTGPYCHFHAQLQGIHLPHTDAQYRHPYNPLDIHGSTQSAPTRPPTPQRR